MFGAWGDPLHRGQLRWDRSRSGRDAVHNFGHEQLEQSVLHLELLR